MCQLMERCDGHGGDVKVLGEVWQLSETGQLSGRCERY